MMKTLKINYNVKIYNKGKSAIVTSPEGTMVYSYNKKVAFRDPQGKIYLDPKFDYSTTTLRHVGAFLCEGESQTRARIAIGDYEVAQLT